MDVSTESTCHANDGNWDGRAGARCILIRVGVSMMGAIRAVGAIGIFKAIGTVMNTIDTDSV